MIGEGVSVDISVEKKRILYLDLARTVAIISISTNHAVNRSYAIYSGQQMEYLQLSFAENIFKAVVYVFSRIGVPLFMMITGVLVLRKSFESEKEVRSFYKYNWGRMLLTTEIWLFIMYWVQCLLDLLGGKELAPLGELIAGCVYNACFINQKTFGSIWYMQMILPLYLVLPVFAVFIKKGGGKYLVLPAGLLFFMSFLIPSVNTFIVRNQGTDSFGITLVEPVAHLVLYIFAGYYISSEQCILRKIRKDVLFGVLTLLLFGICVFDQFYGFGQAYDYHVGYESVSIFVLSCVIFEWFRRNDRAVFPVRRWVHWISSASFAIYFVHIVIMDLLNQLIVFEGWTRYWKLFFLEGVAVGGAVVVIAILSANHLIRKYVFLIK